MKRKATAVAVVILAVSSIAGCYESSGVTIAKQGEYKGKTDPLLSQQAAAREEALKKRFQLVQVDR